MKELLAGQGVRLRIDDQRVLGESFPVRFEGHLTEVQEQAAKSLLAHDLGVFVAPPGVGKTVVGAYLAGRGAVLHPYARLHAIAPVFLGESAFAAAYAAGGSLSYQDAIAEARAWLEQS